MNKQRRALLWEGIGYKVDQRKEEARFKGVPVVLPQSSCSRKILSPYIGGSLPFICKKTGHDLNLAYLENQDEFKLVGIKFTRRFNLCSYKGLTAVEETLTVSWKSV